MPHDRRAWWPGLAALLIIACAAPRRGPTDPVTEPPTLDYTREFEPARLAEAARRWKERRRYVLSVIRRGETAVAIAFLSALEARAPELGVAAIHREEDRARLAISMELDPGSYRVYLMDEVQPCSALVGHDFLGPPDVEDPRYLDVMRVAERGRGRFEHLLETAGAETTGRPLLIVRDGDGLSFCGVFDRFEDLD